MVQPFDAKARDAVRYGLGKEAESAGGPDQDFDIGSSDCGKLYMRNSA